MKNEAEFNTVVSHSLAYGYKIADTFASNSFRSVAPFDGFGIVEGPDEQLKSLYWESKYLKEPGSFNFTRLEDHQIDSLLKFSRVKEAIPVFLIGVNFGRGDIRVFVFQDMDYIAKRKLEGKSIFKKEFLARKNYVKIKKGKIDFKEVWALDKRYEYSEDGTLPMWEQK